jgi:DNA-directed RNA polymerase subunit RPC12/RpoP
MSDEERFWCIQCWSSNLTADGKVTVAKGRKATRFRCRRCGHRSFRRIDSYTDPRVLANILGFYKEGFTLDEPYLSLAKALDRECRRSGGGKIGERWSRIVNKVVREGQVTGVIRP